MTTAMRSRKRLEGVAHDAVKAMVARLRTLGRAIFVGAPNFHCWGGWSHSGYGYEVGVTFEQIPLQGSGKGRMTFTAHGGDGKIDSVIELVELKVARYAALHEDRETQYCRERVTHFRRCLANQQKEIDWWANKFTKDREMFETEISNYERKLREKGVTIP